MILLRIQKTMTHIDKYFNTYSKTNGSEYDPVPFTRDNVNTFIVGEFEIVSINFPGFLKKQFQSNHRPVGVVEINYTDASDNKRTQKIFIKIHPGASKAFEAMKYVYQKMIYSKSHTRIPQPLLFDNEVLFTEYIDGVSLKYYVMHQLLFRQNIKPVSELFYRIGEWLNIFHKNLKFEEQISFKEILLDSKVALKNTSYFSISEKHSIVSLIDNMEIETGNLCLDLIRPHNDFSLRNILVDKFMEFHVVDWDAMIHERFPNKATIWNDVSCFVQNTHSFIKFVPFIRKKDIILLTKSFIEGYFNSEPGIKENEIQKFLWIFALRSYLGLIGDRNLPEIYKKRFGGRYLSRLKISLIAGQPV
jgi:hypothetical protein